MFSNLELLAPIRHIPRLPFHFTKFQPTYLILQDGPVRYIQRQHPNNFGVMYIRYQKRSMAATPVAQRNEA